MSLQLTNDDIDYDKLVEYELNCLHDSDSDSDHAPFLENNITDDDSYDIVLDKISKAHEEFYKSCFQNANGGDDNDDVEDDKLTDSLDHRTMRILQSYNISYEDFVMTLPKISNELELSSDLMSSQELCESKNLEEDNGNNPTQAWMSHENVLQQINKEKWNQYDSFYNKFNERCASARTLANKQLENQVLEEKKRREILQTNMESELKLLEQRWKLDEAENKLKMIELEAEIEEEKRVMVKLKTEIIEVVNVRHNSAAIMIQKIFRKYRIRKRIGAEIDEIRQKARQKLFNKKFIMLEKDNQKKRAIELRKWKKEREKQANDNKIKVIDECKESGVNEEERVDINSDVFKQGNNSNVFACTDDTDAVSIIVSSEENDENSDNVHAPMGSSNDPCNMSVDEEINAVDVEVVQTADNNDSFESKLRSDELMDTYVINDCVALCIDEDQTRETFVEVIDDNILEEKNDNVLQELKVENTESNVDSHDTDNTEKSNNVITSIFCLLENDIKGSENDCNILEFKGLKLGSSVEFRDSCTECCIDDNDELEQEVDKRDEEMVDYVEEINNSATKTLVSMVRQHEERLNELTEAGTLSIYATHAPIDEKCQKLTDDDTLSSNTDMQIVDLQSIKNESIDFLGLDYLTDPIKTNEYLNEILLGNKTLIQICSDWMNFKLSEREIKNVSGSTQILVPSVPKHLFQNSNFNQIIASDELHNVILGPEKDSITTCKSLGITDKRLVSVHGINLTCPMVKNLAINDSSLTSVHSNDLLESLVYLNLDRNLLEWAYFGSSGVSCLTSISCSSNDLSDLPSAAFRGCQALFYLDLSNNNFLSIANILKDTEPLINLCYLNLSGNVLSSMATLPYHCPRLTNIVLSNNHIKHWKSDENFPSLVQCDLANNSLSHIDRLMDTPLLTKLNLSNNGIDCLELFSQSWMPCLSDLCLDSNRLNILPELHFPQLQSISIKKNYLKDTLNVDAIFNDCPLISSIDLSLNITIIGSASRQLGSIIINDQNKNIECRVPCPVGDFATKCYDFVDGIQNKSRTIANNLILTTSMEMSHKHQQHYYRFVRDSVDDFTDWMMAFLFQTKSINNECVLKAAAVVYDQQEIDAIVKIQAFWRGHRVRRWYTRVLRGIRFDTEKSFDELSPADLPEFDENYFLGEWDSNCEILPVPKEAWVHSNRDSRNNDVIVPAAHNEYHNIPPSSHETSYRSSSTGYKQSVNLGKKGIEIMKEWGFEDPNSAKWMLERAKRFRNKVEKNGKKPYSGSRINAESHAPVTSTHRTHKILPLEVAPMSTITLQPPGSSQSNNTKSKIFDWLIDSDPLPLSVSRSRSFLPAIDNDAVTTNKTVTTAARRDSSSTKLPPINLMFINK